MKLKQIAYNAVWFGVVPQLSTVASIFIVPLITPYLSQSDYGVWGIISAYVGTITGFATLGLHMHLTNSYFEYKSRFGFVWRRLMFWMALGSVLCWLLTSILLWVVLPDTAPWSRLLVVGVSTVSVLLNFNLVIVQHYYSIRLKPRPLVVRNLVASLVGVVVLFVSVSYFDWGFMGYVASSAVAAVLVFISFIKPIWIDMKIYPQATRFDYRARQWLTVAIPMIPHNVGHIMLSSADRIVMSILAISIADIGIYSNGYTFGNYVSIVIIALAVSMGPVIQTTFRSGNNAQMRKILVFNQAISIILIFGVSIWMREIYMLLVRNESLQICHTVASYTCFSFAMYPLYAILSTVALIEKRTRQLLWLIFVPALINIGLNFVFIPIYGYRGAIVTTVLSYWLVSIIALTVPYYRAHLRVWLGSEYKILYLPAICLVTIFVAGWIGEGELWLKVVLSMAALVAGIGFYVRHRALFKNFNFVHSDVIND